MFLGNMIFIRYGRFRINLAVRVLWFLALALFAMPTQAEIRTYRIDAQGSLVQFSWDFGKTEMWGRMPLVKADVSIDFEALGRSRVAIALDASNAHAGFAFATQAMRGPSVLDVNKFPLINFVSTSVTWGAPAEARIDGNITIRNVTRPIRLRAEIFRQSGGDQTDLSNLTILLTGTVERSKFGANGWSGVVGDEVRLRILARIYQIN